MRSRDNFNPNEPGNQDLPNGHRAPTEGGFHSELAELVQLDSTRLEVIIKGFDREKLIDLIVSTFRPKLREEKRLALFAAAESATSTATLRDVALECILIVKDRGQLNSNESRPQHLPAPGSVRPKAGDPGTRVSPRPNLSGIEGRKDPGTNYFPSGAKSPSRRGHRETED